MSVIVPAGSKRREWVPQDPMVRTASTEGEEQPKDELLEAAMGVLDRQAQEEAVVIEAAEKCEKCEKCCDECECEKEVKADADEDEVKEASICEEGEPEIACEEEATDPEAVLEEVSDDGVVTEEEEEVVEEAAVEKIKGAVEVIEIALEEVTEAEEALTKVKDAIGTVEEVHEKMTEEEGDEEGEVSFTEEVIEDSVEDEEAPVVASSPEEFCRFAKISPKNRAKVADYWKNSLGYPADYVDLLTKDYEK